jgi:hypothetical protein
VILFLFLAHLGIGIAFTLLFVSREAGVKFFRFNAGLAVTLVAIALVFAPGRVGQVGLVGQVGPDGTDVPERQAGLEGQLSLQAPAGIALAAFEVLIVFYWATVGRALTRFRPIVLLIAVSVGSVALVLQSIAISAGDPVPMRFLTIVSVLSSAAFLGGACTAMILGHWYLVIPSLEVEHLQSIVRFHIASMVIRIAVVGAAVFAALAIWGSGPAAAGVVNFRRYITSVDGIFFWQRVLFGLAGPVVLSYLTWETAKIRSTQSATGILYVDFFTVVVGEVLAKYLLLATRVPL